MPSVGRRRGFNMALSKIGCWLGLHDPAPRRQVGYGYGDRCRFVCAVCGKHVQRVLDRHDWGQESNEKDCRIVKCCRACGVKIMLRTEHSFTPFSYVQDGNCAQSSVCTMCGHQQTRTEHTFVGFTRDAQCSRCGFVDYNDCDDNDYDSGECPRCGRVGCDGRGIDDHRYR
jgi:hypothetical protein